MNLPHKVIGKYKVLSKPARASLWFTGCYVIQRGLQFIGMPIYTRIMSTTEYGVYSVFLSWFNLICVFSSLSIYNGTFNKAMIKYEKTRDQYISSVQCLTTIVTLMFILFFMCIHNLITKWTGFEIKFQLLLYVHLLMFPTLQYWSQKQRFLFEYKKLVCVTLVNSIMSLAFGILFVLTSKDKSFALITVTVAVQAIINGILYISLIKKGKCMYHSTYWSWTLVTAVPLIPHYLSEILLGHADRLMINQMCGSGQAGVYNIVYQISMIMTILRTGINASFTPWLYYALKEKTYESVRKITALITILMWGITFLLMLIGPEILKIVAPKTYYEAVIDIPAIMIGCFFIYIYVLFLNVEIYFEQNQFVAVASIIAAILNMVLNYICIQAFGYLAAGYTTMISYMTMAILHYCFLRKIIKKNNELNRIFDFKLILFLSIILVFLGGILLKLYEWFLLRLLLIMVIWIVVVVKKKTIMDVFLTLGNKK